VASGTVSFLLAAEVARQAKGFARNDSLDSEDSEGESLMGSRTDTRRTAETGDRSEQTDHPVKPGRPS
jgi:hypothetical protein